MTTQQTVKDFIDVIKLRFSKCSEEWAHSSNASCMWLEYNIVLSFLKDIVNIGLSITSVNLFNFIAFYFSYINLSFRSMIYMYFVYHQSVHKNEKNMTFLL